MLGATLGQYRITRLIGEGGMGAVYAAEHVLLGRPAAVKVLLPALSANQEMVQRFFNEARSAAAIRHPSIVEIYDFGWHTDGAAFIAMEELQGESLAARLARGRMSQPGALTVARQIAGALAAAHAKGIVHRDLKPDNIFLVPDSEVIGGERTKLLDFGIAKLQSDAGGSHTRTGALMGTPTYMAPEQCRGVAVDYRADLYSLGCILFELLSGRPPFVGEGVGDVLAAHIHVGAPSVASVAGVPVPPEIEQIVARLLAKDPAQRIQSAEEVVHAIDRATGSALRTAPQMDARMSGGMPMPTAPAHTTLGAAASSATVATAPKKRTGLIIGVGAAIVGAAVGVGVIAAKSRGGSADAPAPATKVAVATPTVSIDAPPAPPPTDAAPALDAPSGSPAIAPPDPVPDKPVPEKPAPDKPVPVVAPEKPAPAKPPKPSHAVPSCADVTAHLIRLAGASDLPDAAAASAMLRARCSDDHWSDAARRCFGAVKTGRDADACAKQLTAAQKRAVERAVATASRPAPRPAPTPPPPPAEVVPPPAPKHSVWRGAYTCGQGRTALVLTIDTDGSIATAQVHFGPLGENPSVPSGDYVMRGSVAMRGDGSMSVQLAPDHWVRQPTGYQMVGMSGVTDARLRTLSGRVLHSSCSTLSAVRD